MRVFCCHGCCTPLGTIPEMDYSGALTCILKQAGVQSPRSSPGQFSWLKNSLGLSLVPSDSRHISDAGYRKLKPGDLLFSVADSDKAPAVCHVQMDQSLRVISTNTSSSVGSSRKTVRSGQPYCAESNATDSLTSLFESLRI